MQRSVLLAELPSLNVRRGMPLPWDVHDQDGQLLLARGQVVASDSVLATLIARGGRVRLGDATRAAAPSAPMSKPLAARYTVIKRNLAWLLAHPEERDFLDRVRHTAGLVADLTERDVDQLIFLIIRHDHLRFAVYGSAHALHVATVCSILAHRLRWPRERHLRLVCAALTMNLSIIALQGVLAGWVGPLTEAQRAEIHTHPDRSADMLRACGATDEAWLAIVAQHHEEAGGMGYPHGIDAPTEDARMLGFADQFTAKHAWRADRGVVPAQQVARELYTQSQGHPLAALLIKEFGIFPPGCFVQLASGEAAVVVRRGAGANTPVVAALIDVNGNTLTQPIVRDSARAEHAIVNTLDERTVLAHVSLETLYALG